MSRLPARLALALCAYLPLTAASATTYAPAEPETLLLQADLVFVGTVGAVRADLSGGYPWTRVSFEKLTVLRNREAQEAGTAPPDELTLDFLGGAAPLAPTLMVSGLPVFAVGESWLVAAYQREGLASPVTGLAQGAWVLEAASARATDGSYLSVTDDGALVRGPSSPGLPELLEAVKAVLARGMPSAPARAPQGEQPAAQATSAEAAPGEPATTEDAAEGAAPVPEAAPAATREAVAYRAIDEGGPLLLSTYAAAAAKAWEAAAPEAAAFDVDGAAKAVIRYGPPELFGTDSTSLTLVSGDGRVEVLVSPDAGSALPAVLLHELGVLLGLPEGGAGVMAFTVAPTLDAPTRADVGQLLALRTYAPEDLDRSGRVDFYDLVLFGQAYGQRGVNLAADFDGNGVVDDADLARLREAYQFAAPSAEPSY